MHVLGLCPGIADRLRAVVSKGRFRKGACLLIQPALDYPGKLPAPLPLWLECNRAPLPQAALAVIWEGAQVSQFITDKVLPAQTLLVLESMSWLR